MKETPDYIDRHPLDRVIRWPLGLKDVRVVLEGTDPEGNVYRLRTGIVEEPKVVELLEVERTEPVGDNAVPKPSVHHVVVAGRITPDDAEGVVYWIEQLREREL